jgi:hypothetical protein
MVGKMGGRAKTLGKASGKLGATVQKMGVVVRKLGAAPKIMGAAFGKTGAVVGKLGAWLQIMGAATEKSGAGGRPRPAAVRKTGLPNRHFSSGREIGRTVADFVSAVAAVANLTKMAD